MTPQSDSEYKSAWGLYNAQEGRVVYEVAHRADDGLPAWPVGAWGEQKLRLLATFCSMFTQAMRGKWDNLIYVDLFAGCGCSRIRGTRKFITGSPLAALDISPPFDRYVLCEKDEGLMAALRTRILTEHPGKDVRFIEGDVNRLVPVILEQIPTPGPRNRVLTLSVADPFRLRNLRFKTLEALSTLFMDHFILVPTHMDANRNWRHYTRPENRVVDDFLGHTTWRGEWSIASRRGEPIGNFLTNSLGKAMERLGYKYGGIETTVLIRSDVQNLPLYRLVLLSRHDLGGKFWTQAKKYGRDQGEINFD